MALSRGVEAKEEAREAHEVCNVLAQQQRSGVAREQRKTGSCSDGASTHRQSGRKTSGKSKIGGDEKREVKQRERAAAKERTSAGRHGLLAHAHMQTRAHTRWRRRPARLQYTHGKETPARKSVRAPTHAHTHRQQTAAAGKAQRSCGAPFSLHLDRFVYVRYF